MKNKTITIILVSVFVLALASVTAVDLGTFLSNTEIKGEYFDELELKYGTDNLSATKSDCVPFSTKQCKFYVEGIGIHSYDNVLSMYDCTLSNETTGECITEVEYTTEELSQQIDEFIERKRIKDAKTSKERRLAKELEIIPTGGTNTLLKK